MDSFRSTNRHWTHSSTEGREGRGGHCLKHHLRLVRVPHYWTSDVLRRHAPFNSRSHAHHMLITHSSHAHHMLITCSSHAHHMLITRSSHAHHTLITRSSHAHDMLITCSSHSSHAHHMLITCSSHAHHMLITCMSCDPMLLTWWWVMQHKMIVETQPENGVEVITVTANKC